MNRIEPKPGKERAPGRLTRERLPLVAVTGTNGKTTVTRMVAHIAEYMGVPVGTNAMGHGASGDLSTGRGDRNGFRSVEAALADPNVVLAVLEIAQGDVAGHGLGYEEADAAVLLNADRDLLGEGAFDGASAFGRMLSLVTESVREGGALILNVDDPHLRAVLEDPRVQRTLRRVVIFSLDLGSSTVRGHLEAGGLAYGLRDGWIVEASGASEKRVVRIMDLPVTLGGVARFQIVNALAAVAAARAVGFGVAEVSCGLKTFESARHNAGRGELYWVRGGYVLLDSAKRPACMEALCETVGQWPARRITGVLSAPDDHRDGASWKMAARSFDQLFLKDERESRRREPGQAPELLRGAIRAEMPDYPCAVVLNEDEAVARAISEMVPGEVVVVISDSPERMRGILEQAEAVPVWGFERQAHGMELSLA